MSDKEKALVERLGKLPDAVQDRFLDMANGALMALDIKEEEETCEKSPTTETS